jgi:bifunctional N-acetylglucosamine-1-phosphate-uridyltransferase/glucosamine-1-phosphate-acetyltransferase GlmU-like protein
MNTKVNFILLAGGYGTQFRNHYPNIHSSLIPIHNNPCICILLETILSLNNLVDTVYIICFQRYASSFHKEISRRFYNEYKIKLVEIEDTNGTAASLQLFLNQTSLLNPNLCILNSNIPLISKMILQDFIMDCYHSSIKLAVSNLKKNVDEYEKVIHSENPIIESHLNKNIDSFEFIFLNMFFIKQNILQKYINFINSNLYSTKYEIYDIFQYISEYKKELFLIHSYIANKEFILLNSMEDKNYIEDIYSEKKNAIFISSCYELWKKFENLENRISFLENKIQN